MNLGHTPESFGHKIGVSGRTIRRIEEGTRPTVRVMFAIAQELGVDVADLWL